MVLATQAQQGSRIFILLSGGGLWFTCRSYLWADVAQEVERVLGKDEVTGSSPVIGSSLRSPGIGRASVELRLAGQQAVLRRLSAVVLAKTDTRRGGRKETAAAGVGLHPSGARTHGEGKI